MTKELTKKQKIYVINEMIRYYKYVKFEWRGMCSLASCIIINDLKKSECYLAENIPEFYDNFPDNIFMVYWFPVGERKPRIKYCQKILKIINKPKN